MQDLITYYMRGVFELNPCTEKSGLFIINSHNYIQKITSLLLTHINIKNENYIYQHFITK